MGTFYLVNLFTYIYLFFVLLKNKTNTFKFYIYYKNIISMRFPFNNR